MLPIWFFLVLMTAICTLLFLIRTREEALAGMNKSHFRKVQLWVRSIAERRQSA